LPPGKGVRENADGHLRYRETVEFSMSWIELE